jgi:hypothetical protein
MKNILPAILLLTTTMLPISLASASTTIEYAAQCQYFNANKVLKYSGKCQGNWGVVAPTPEDSYQRYILTYPNGNEIWIYINSDGSTTVNDIPALSLKSRNGFEKVVTTEGEVFEFTKGGEKR